MQFSEKWLRQWVDPQINVQTLCTQLTMAGLEVDGVDQTCAIPAGVVVARLTSVDAHPSRQKLKVCTLDYGAAKKTTIISSAANIYPGLVTVFANIGTRLPNNIDIKSVAFDGIWSHGALCSEKMLGLSDDSRHAIVIDDTVPVGTALDELVHSADHLIELSITPNRGDCLSIRGIAREIAAINQCSLNAVDTASVKPTTQHARKVTVAAPAACPRYLGRVIEQVDCSRLSPLWLRERLRRCGIQPINAVVDITNYVMMELGQPLHAFDNDKLSGAITVRYARREEQCKLLNGMECTPSEDTLLVADENGPIALAGIIGGLNSSVHTESSNIFLECAYFSAANIIGKARQYRLHTDACYRFERGVDPQLQLCAIEKATALVVAICGGNAGPVVETKNDKYIPKPTAIRLRESQIKRVLGIDITATHTMASLERLGMQIKKDGDSWQVVPPSHRFDIRIEADLIEELARMQGYDTIPYTSPHVPLSIRPDNKLRQKMAFAQVVLAQRGYQEAINFSFADPKIQSLLGDTTDAINLINPISPACSAMRISLWPGLINAALYNLHRQQSRVRLFESGCVFKKQATLLQSRHIGGIVIGDLYDTQWGVDNRPCDLYDIKADIDVLLRGLTNQPLLYLAATHPLLHPGQTTKIYIKDTMIGQFGRIAVTIASDLKLPADCYLFELYMEKIPAQATPSFHIAKPSRFPAVRRDLALLVDEKVTAADILGFIQLQLATDLADLELFDVYRGKDIDADKKSLALSLVFQKPSGTFKDSEIESITSRLLADLETEFNAKLRI